MRRVITVIGMQVYAVGLAFFQNGIGVRTDEAKYLLDIPYPHPPLARFVINATEWLPGHDLIWRIIFATLLVQSAWLIWSLTTERTSLQRTALMLAWLLSSAVVFQGGTVMMAVLTGVQAMVFVWLYLRAKDNTSHAELIGLFWLASLFTAYQAILFSPLVWGIVMRMRIPLLRRLMIFGAPIDLLILYTLTNPLALASMTLHAEKDVAQTLLERLIETGWVWALGGSIILSALGTFALMRSWRWPLVLSFLLVLAYIFLSRYDYYAVLFTPLFFAGLILLLKRHSNIARSLVLLTIIGTVTLYFLRPPQRDPSIVPVVMKAINLQQSEGDLLINGSFGHEWQYASPVPVRRYASAFLDGAQAVICLTPCSDIQKQTGWVEHTGLPVETWVKE